MGTNARYRGHDSIYFGELLDRFDKFCDTLVYLLYLLIEFRDDMSSALRNHCLDGRLLHSESLFASTHLKAASVSYDHLTVEEQLT